MNRNSVRFDTKDKDRTKITLSGFDSRQTVHMGINGQTKEMKSDDLGNISIFFEQASCI